MGQTGDNCHEVGLHLQYGDTHRSDFVCGKPWGGGTTVAFGQLIR